MNGYLGQYRGSIKQNVLFRTVSTDSCLKHDEIDSPFRQMAEKSMTSIIRLAPSKKKDEGIVKTFGNKR